MVQIFESLFVSEISAHLEPREIANIVRVSRANNNAKGLTGVLMFDGARFCQHLEGPEMIVRQTAEKIAMDPRHTRFLPLHAGHIGCKRRFEAWHVGVLESEGPSPLLAFESLHGSVAIEHLVSVFRDRQKHHMMVM